MVIPDWYEEVVECQPAPQAYTTLLMAVLVSHAMHRFPSTPHDPGYSSSYLRAESTSGSSTQRHYEGERGALSRSMRYADPWLYGSVRGSPAGGFLLAPALILCQCPDYLNGTTRSRSSKKSPHTCKKCKGTRLPLNGLDSKSGTVRCYPTYHQTTPSTPLRAGTVRVTSSSTRPSILPTADPYDLMRRSRLSVPEGSTADFRDIRELSAAKSPNTRTSVDLSNWSEDGDNSKKGSKKDSASYNSTFGRRSILECSVNPYDLMSPNSKSEKLEPHDAKGKEVKNVTVVNGQRIRVRPNIDNAFSDYEDVQSPTKSSLFELPFAFLKSGNKLKSPTRNQVSIAPKSKSLSPEKESNLDCNTITRGRFKSILKKSPGYYSDVETSCRDYEEGSFPQIGKGNVRSRSSGSQFYLPTPLPMTPRKKVQFSDAKECLSAEDSGQESSSSGIEDMQGSSSNEEEEYSEPLLMKQTIAESKTEQVKDREEQEDDDVFEDALEEPKEKEEAFRNEEKPIKKPLTLKRSLSDRSKKELQSKNITFHDTMALRGRKRTNTKIVFSDEDLEKLDGLTLRARKISPRPNIAPPPPPDSNSKATQNDSPSNNNEYLTEIGSPNKGTITTPSYNFGPKDRDRRSPVKNVESLDQTPPCAPPRKRSGNKQPFLNITSLKTNSLLLESLPAKNNDSAVKKDHILPDCATKSNTNTILKIESPTQKDVIISPSTNKTIVQISSQPTIHKIQIKNEFSDIDNQKNYSPMEGGQRKTSILINGEGDCYCTVNVNDNVPLYQSSVVVHNDGSSINDNKAKASSKIYITGTFVNTDNLTTERIFEDQKIAQESKIAVEPALSKQLNKLALNEEKIVVPEKIAKENDLLNNLLTENDTVDKVHLPVKSPPVLPNRDLDHLKQLKSTEEPFNITTSPRNTSDVIKEILRNPVEAVRQNLVPHICGKSDMSRRSHKLNSPQVSQQTSPRTIPKFSLLPQEDFVIDSSLDNSSLEDSFLRLRNYESIGDEVSSEHSSSTQYEPMDLGSDCYTDHSNRSSVTEEELVSRAKFYELLADTEHIEISENEDHHYESIKVNNDPIYEEIEIPPPLPSNPPPVSLLDDLHLDKEYTTRSIFEGASKYDILSYLVDAKERGIEQEDGYSYTLPNNSIHEEDNNRLNTHMSTVSDSSEDNSLIISGAIIDDKLGFQKPAEVERNDSGVGSETSKSSLSKYRTKQEVLVCCEDCDYPLDSKDNEPLLCKKCLKKRSERKETITEIVETEEKYSKDLQIILEEFYQPMLVAGLLTPDQLSAIFLNVEELLENSQALAERLRDAVEIAQEQGDDDLLTVNIGKLFIEAAPMLHAFETYCVRQGTASLLLASLEKEKELLRIFLRVSQMENTLLRRMNLNSFLMVPVQRVTKYPLLLARLYKVTPGHHDTRDLLKEAQHKIELHLNHMNSETKDVPSKLWRRIGSSSGRRPSTEMDLVNIKLRKIAVDVLEWNHDEAKFVMEGKLLFTQPTDNYWRKGRTIKLTHINALLVTNGKVIVTKSSEKQEENCLVFSKNSGVREAALLLVRDKNGRYSLLREPLYLDKCIIAADPAWQSYFEVQEVMGKDTFIFKAEDEVQTQLWYKHLQYHAQGLGAWRKRRNALANIMINGMGLRT